MKPTLLLLIASLVANVAFIAAALTRNPRAITAPAAMAPSPTTPTRLDASIEALRAALASGDPAALAAAGLSPDLARQLAVGRAFATYAERLRALRASRDNTPWWRYARSNASAAGQTAAWRELEEAMAAAYGPDALFGDAGPRDLGFLSPAKRDALRRITRDYDEMMAKFSEGGIQLASDRERLQLLRTERDRDIAALLTPDELAEYEMRTSPTAAMLSSRFGDAIQSEEDFRKLYALQKAFDDKFPRDAFAGRITPEMMQQRAAAERQLQADMRAAFGDEKYAELRRAADPDLQTVDSLVARLGLSPATTSQIAAVRDRYAAESQRISSDSSLPHPERSAQLQALAAQAKAELQRALGAEGADAYAQRSPWLNMLQGGMAYSTNPDNAPPGAMLMGGGTSVYPVLPAGIRGGAGVRQMVNVVNASGGAMPARGATMGGMLMPGAAGAAPVENTQVFSFARIEASPAPPTPGAQDGTPAAARPVFVVPATPPATPPTPAR